jgi:hypothetical protein
MRISKGLRQAYQLQDFVYEATLALKESRTFKEKLAINREDASAIASLIKAWESCQERIRIHRDKPMPGVLKPVAKIRRKSATGLLVSTPPSPPAPTLETLGRSQDHLT